MAERIDEWPRCHSCLYNWCQEKSDECARCDAVCAIMQQPLTRVYDSSSWTGRQPRLKKFYVTYELAVDLPVRP